MPSLIPKLLSPRSKEEKLKRQDSKDDIRSVWKSSRKDSKEESTKGFAFGKEDFKHGIRIFRRDNSREDVGRESRNSNANAAAAVAAKGKQSGKEEKQDRTEERVGVSTASKSKSTVHEHIRTKVTGRESKETPDGEPTRRDEETPVYLDQNERVRIEAAVSNEETMLDVVVADEKLLEGQEGVKRSEKSEKKETEEKRPTDPGKEEDPMGQEEQVSENENNIHSMKESAESFLENVDTDVTAYGTNEQKAVADFPHGKKSDDFQVVSKSRPMCFVVLKYRTTER